MEIDVTRLREAREGHRLGVPLVYHASTPSTNDDALALARSGAEEGTTVLADQQTKGRGRLGRTWVSPPGSNVYLSVVLRPPIPASQVGHLPIVAGVAVVEAVRVWVPWATLKWPNDVLVDQRKVAGVLSEVCTEGERVQFVVLGIGVNVNQRIEQFPPELREIAGSLAEAVGREVDRTDVALAVLDCLEREYETYLQHGFEPVRIRWADRSATIGRLVRVDAGKETVEGEALGLSQNGGLELRVPGGKVVEVLAGDVWVHEPGGAGN